MEISAYLVFVAVAALQLATPGPSTLFVVRNASAYGRRRTVGSGTSVLALPVTTVVAVKRQVLGGDALGARTVGRLVGRSRNARRGRIAAGLLFMAFGALMIRAALADYAQPVAGATAAP